MNFQSYSILFNPFFVPYIANKVTERIIKTEIQSSCEMVVKQSKNAMNKNMVRGVTVVRNYVMVFLYWKSIFVFIYIQLCHVTVQNKNQN